MFLCPIRLINRILKVTFTVNNFQRHRELLFVYIENAYVFVARLHNFLYSFLFDFCYHLLYIYFIFRKKTTNH